MAEYSANDARRDLKLLSELTADDSVNRLAKYTDWLEARAESAERVCEAAAEVVPSVKRDLVQQRQTRFLRALAEWREAQK